MGTKSSNTSAREALAEALAAEADARDALKDAQTAASRASQLIFGMMSAVDDLERQIAEADRNPRALIEALAAGGGVAELVESSSALRQKLAAKQTELDTLRQARDAAEQEIPVRQNALDWAGRNVARLAAEVVAAEIDVAPLIAAAASAQEGVMAQRAELLAINRAMAEGEAKTRLAVFLAEPWLIDEMRGDWTKRPEAIRVEHWAEALKRDARAERPPL